MTHSTYPPREKQWRHGSNREETVHNLVHTYTTLRERSPALRYLARDPILYPLFCEIIEQQISLIRSRHQEIEDGHVTVFDKALSILSQSSSSSGIDKNLGVQELYIREYIGISPDATPHVIEETLARNIWIKGFLTKFAAPAPIKRESPTADAETAKEHHQHHHHPQENPPHPHTDLRDYDISSDPVAVDNINILLKYFEAKRDFYNLNSTNYEEKAVAARYLRDTAENAKRYVTSDHLLKEIDEVFEYARKKAEDILGGKKRRFEVEQLQRGVRSRTRTPVRYSPYYYNCRDRESFTGSRQRRYYHHS